MTKRWYRVKVVNRSLECQAGADLTFQATSHERASDVAKSLANFVSLLVVESLARDLAPLSGGDPRRVEITVVEEVGA